MKVSNSEVHNFQALKRTEIIATEELQGRDYAICFCDMALIVIYGKKENRSTKVVKNDGTPVQP